MGLDLVLDLNAAPPYPILGQKKIRKNYPQFFSVFRRSQRSRSSLQDFSFYILSMNSEIFGDVMVGTAV
jgi:hypothetical protein